MFPFVLSLSKGHERTPPVRMVRQAHHERAGGSMNGPGEGTNGRGARAFPFTLSLSKGHNG